MKAIVSGRAGRALIIEDGILKSFDVDDPSKIVLRQESDLPYLFGDASDLHVVDNATTIASVADELRGDCNFTRALDLTLISLDAEVSREVRSEALEGLAELLAPWTLNKLKNLFYAEPLPADGDLTGALALCDGPNTIVALEFLKDLLAVQPLISLVKQAWTAIPFDMFRDEQIQETLHAVAINEGFFRSLVEHLYDKKPERFEPGLGVYVKHFASSTSMLARFTYREVIDCFTENLIHLYKTFQNDHSEEKLAG